MSEPKFWDICGSLAEEVTNAWDPIPEGFTRVVNYNYLVTVWADKMEFKLKAERYKEELAKMKPAGHVSDEFANLQNDVHKLNNEIQNLLLRLEKHEGMG